MRGNKNLNELEGRCYLYITEGVPPRRSQETIIWQPRANRSISSRPAMRLTLTGIEAVLERIRVFADVSSARENSGAGLQEQDGATGRASRAREWKGCEEGPELLLRVLSAGCLANFIT